MAKEDVMAINSYGLTRRTRTLKSGATKSRYTVSISSEPVLVNTNPKALCRGIADATEQILKDRIDAIQETASPATIKARQSALKGVMQGAPWAMRRYGGGRMGTRAPGRSDRLFNDSGRFLESIKVGATKDGWVINVAANRLDPSTLNGGEAALLRIVERLKEFVPEWGDAKRLMENLQFRRALDASVSNALKKATERTKELQMQLMQQTVGRLLRLVA